MKYGKTVGKVSVEPKFTIAYAISSAREEHGLSQSQLSQLCGVANPTIETLSKICKVLGLEVMISKTRA